MQILILFILAFHVQTAFAQMKPFSGIHDPIDTVLTKFLQEANYGKMVTYFDNKYQIDGEWHYYPKVEIGNSILAVSVRTVQDNLTPYNYVLFWSRESNSVIQKIGPFYDSYPSAIETKLLGKKLRSVRLKLTNPPSEFDEKYTIIEYDNVGDKLEKTKEYGQN